MVIDARQYVTNPAGFGTINKPIGIALHHSVSGGTFFMAGQTTPSDEINHIKMIDQYHVSIGFGGFAYHAAAFASGNIYQTGDWNSQRAHVKGRNHELGSVVAIGNYSVVLGPPNLIKALGEGYHAQEVYWMDSLTLAGHKEWALPGWGTFCPGRLVEQKAQIEGEEEDDMGMTDAEKAEFAALKRKVDDQAKEQDFIQQAIREMRWGLDVAAKGQKKKPGGV